MSEGGEKMRTQRVVTFVLIVAAFALIVGVLAFLGSLYDFFFGDGDMPTRLSIMKGWVISTYFIGLLLGLIAAWVGEIWHEHSVVHNYGITVAILLGLLLLNWYNLANETFVDNTVSLVLGGINVGLVIVVLIAFVIYTIMGIFRPIVLVTQPQQNTQAPIGTL